MISVWNKFGGDFFLKEETAKVNFLPVGVYKILQTPHEEFYVQHIRDSFTFPYKIYGIEQNLINRILKSYQNTDGNFGVLFNGVKGTGKTITAEILCNKLQLPVLIVTFHSDGLVSFLNNIQQDFILFIDEFEKIYDGYKTSLLSIMDGVLTKENRIVFLLTTNELRIDSNLIQRPSRIRYLKKFNDLPLTTIIEIVDDMLIYPEFKEEVIKSIAKLPIITIDLIKCIIQEVNIHKEDPGYFLDLLNIKDNSDVVYNVFKLDGDTKIPIFENVQISPYPFVKGEYLKLHHEYIGTIQEYTESTVTVYPDPCETSVIEYVQLVDKELVTKTITRFGTWFIEPKVKYHSSFTHYF